MDPTQVFCPHEACPARGRRGAGNLVIHSQKQQRYKCKVCGKTFSATYGTPLYRTRLPPEMVVCVVTLLAYGCPVAAIVAAYGLDERTVWSWYQRAGQHAEQVHRHVVQQPRDLQQVQADELRVKQQGAVLWVAVALQVATRLWLGGVVSRRRDQALVQRLMAQVKACALCRPLLICVDGFSGYLRAIEKTFREPLHLGVPQRPRLVAWAQLCIGQVVKQYERHRVVGVRQQIVQGTPAQVAALLHDSQGRGVLNTAFCERWNATLRARLAPLTRRTRALSRHPHTVQHGLYLVGTLYNFCTPHASLRLPLYLPGRVRWVARTPAMAAGLTNHCWSVAEFLAFAVPPAPWRPPKRRGRPSNATKQLLAQWAA